MSEVSAPRAPVALGVLLSGRGSNFQAIADAIRSGLLLGCEIVVVLSNVADAPGLVAAQRLGSARGLTASAWPTITLVSKGTARAEHDRNMADALLRSGVELVLLAGYMRVLTADFLRTFPNRVLNIHPSLLPAFPGLHAQRQALDYGATVAGCTVHFVDEAVDHGVIILQRTVTVEPVDTEATLAERILREEHVAYPEAIARVLSGTYVVHGRRYLPVEPSMGRVVQ